MGNKILIESLLWTPAIVEGKGDTTNFRFKFMDDKVNVNKRRYPIAVLGHAISEAQKLIDQGQSIYGSLGHLKEFNVSDISHRILSLSMNGSDAIAEAAVLATAKGKDLLAVISSGGQIGVSARGTGNVISEAGIDIVQSDYQLHGIDCVISPSFSSCHIGSENIYESADFSGIERQPVAVTWQLFEEARRAGFKGSIEAFEESVSKPELFDKQLLREWREAKAAGSPLSYRDFWIAYLAKHGD